MMSPAERTQLLAVLGVMSAAKLSAFGALTANSTKAPDLRSRIGLSIRAGVQIERMQLIHEILHEELDTDPVVAMAAYVPVVDSYDTGAPASDWWEALLKAYIGHGVAGDLEREFVDRLDDYWQHRLSPVVSAGGSSRYVERMVAATAVSDQRWASRLSLWGRRVVGEALSIGQRLFHEHPELLDLIAGDGPRDQAMSKLQGRLTAEHARRMDRLGLTA